MKHRTAFALVAVALLGSASLASAQTPSTGGGSGGAATVGSDARAVGESPRNRDAGVTTGSAANDRSGLTPKSPTNAPLPNAAISKPPADAAAPAGH